MQIDKRFIVTILAGGEGKRMNNENPKVLCPFLGEPMIVRILKVVTQLHPNKILVVVGKHRYHIQSVIETFIADTSLIEYVDQPVPQGTGDAIKCCFPYYDSNDRILILNGDMPCITHDFLQNLLVSASRQLCVIVAANVENPQGYGRIELNTQNEFRRIIEDRDCTLEQKKIGLINTGIYLVMGSILFSCVPSITNENRQKEYYLPDMFLLHKRYSTIPVTIYEINNSDSWIIQGVNTMEELRIAEESAKYNQPQIYEDI